MESYSVAKLNYLTIKQELDDADLMLESGTNPPPPFLFLSLFILIIFNFPPTPPPPTLYTSED